MLAINQEVSGQELLFLSGQPITGLTTSNPQNCLTIRLEGDTNLTSFTYELNYQQMVVIKTILSSITSI